MPLIKITEQVEDQELILLIDVDEPQKDDPYKDSRDFPIDKVKDSIRDVFDDGIAMARACAYKVVVGMNKLDESYRPEEFELKLGISLDSDVGAFVAKAGASAQLEVTMKWKPRNVEPQKNPESKSDASKS